MSARTRIKICGVTQAEDLRLAARLGVDAIGMVFARRSSRRLELAQAVALRAALPPYVTLVALFMDDAAERVREVEQALRPDLLQFHGGEEAAFCAAFDTPYVKALPMGSTADVAAAVAAHPRAAGFLLDSHAAGQPGGSGRRFDWSRVPANLDRPLIVAGGLDAANVGEAIRRTRPWAVDVSSGVESAPGIKDAGKMADFIAAVHAADTA
ncbi:MAG TPA: phosphoribosylanthranilate isomerase [Rhodanobacteraceae bacterium]|nr:phosphoribosylanthranilate isomerase [Rhodanobacteraceae bacterium]